MAEIIPFPSLRSRRDRAIDKIGEELFVRMTDFFDEYGIEDVPLNYYIEKMCAAIRTDAVLSDDALLDRIAEDEAIMLRIEGIFIRLLVSNGVISTDFR
jgi:hypothetical protein